MHGARRLPKRRPMSLSDCPSFHRFQSSYRCSVLRPRFALATRYAFHETVTTSARCIDPWNLPVTFSLRSDIRDDFCGQVFAVCLRL